jgi:hypothetical protein
MLRFFTVSRLALNTNLILEIGSNIKFHLTCQMDKFYHMVFSNFVGEEGPRIPGVKD